MWPPLPKHIPTYSVIWCNNSRYPRPSGGKLKEVVECDEEQEVKEFQRKAFGTHKCDRISPIYRGGCRFEFHCLVSAVGIITLWYSNIIIMLPWVGSCIIKEPGLTRCRFLPLCQTMTWRLQRSRRRKVSDRIFHGCLFTLTPPLKHTEGEWVV